MTDSEAARMVAEINQAAPKDLATAKVKFEAEMKAQYRKAHTLNFDQGMHGYYTENLYQEYGLSSVYHLEIFNFSEHADCVEKVIEILESDVEALKKYLTSLKNSRV